MIIIMNMKMTIMVLIREMIISNKGKKLSIIKFPIINKI